MNDYLEQEFKRVLRKNPVRGGGSVTAEGLAKLFNCYSEKNEFKPGDLVQWKEELKNCKFPEYGVPMVVMEMIEPIFQDDAEIGTPYWHERLDIKVGTIQQGDFCFYYLDSNRLEPYKS